MKMDDRTKEIKGKWIKYPYDYIAIKCRGRLIYYKRMTETQHSKEIESNSF